MNHSYAHVSLNPCPCHPAKPVRRGKRQLPDHIPGTVKQWRAKKRRELENIQRAFDRFGVGAAFLPLVSRAGVLVWLREQREALRGNWHPQTKERA